MIASIVTVAMTLSSAALFVYWFRYTCLLILRAKTARDYAADVAFANNLAFHAVQAELPVAGSSELDRLRTALDNDYKVVRQLLKYMPQSGEGQSALEIKMLEINYQAMGAWYQVCRHFSGSTAAQALNEMSMVVAHFANQMGEQGAASAAA
jgi:hypothetical protein